MVLRSIFATVVVAIIILFAGMFMVLLNHVCWCGIYVR